jgi:aarF domain-containing kinase
VKAIDAVSREQLLQVAASFGIRNPTPVFGMVPVRSSALLPTITEEDRVILNNVEKVVKFLTAGTGNPTINGVCMLNH